MQFQIPDKDYIFDIDLDFRAPEMGISNFEQTIKNTKNLISSAKMVTIATSPYFLDQKQALELIKLAFEWGFTIIPKTLSFLLHANGTD